MGRQSGEAHSFVCWGGDDSEKKWRRLERGPQFDWRGGGGSGRGNWVATTRGGAVLAFVQAWLWKNEVATRAGLTVSLGRWRWKWRQQVVGRHSGEAHGFVCWGGDDSKKKWRRRERGPQFDWLGGGGVEAGVAEATG